MAARKRPVITVVDARPMGEVNFKCSNNQTNKEAVNLNKNIHPLKPTKPARMIVNKTASTLSLSNKHEISNSSDSNNAKKENKFDKPIPAVRKCLLSNTSEVSVNAIKSIFEEGKLYNSTHEPSKQQFGNTNQNGNLDWISTSGISSDSISFSEARSRFGGNWFGDKEELGVSPISLNQRYKATVIRPKSTFFKEMFITGSPDLLNNERNIKTDSGDINVLNLTPNQDIDVKSESAQPKSCLPRKPTIIKPKPLSKSMIFLDSIKNIHEDKNRPSNDFVLKTFEFSDYEQPKCWTPKNFEQISNDGNKNIDLLDGLDFDHNSYKKDFATNSLETLSDFSTSSIPATRLEDTKIVSNHFPAFEESCVTNSRPPRPAVGPQKQNHQPLANCSTSFNKSEPRGPRALALFDYQSGHGEDINFKAGDVIMLDGLVDETWMKGHKWIGGEIGMFPSTFVQIIEPLCNDSPEIKLPSDLSDNKPRCVAKYDFEGLQDNGELSFKEGDIIFLNEKVNDEWFDGQHGKTNERGIFPLSYVEVIQDLTENKEANSNENILKKVVALYDFNGGQEGDLIFRAGDAIDIIKEINGEWFEGKIGEQSGIFPSNFVNDL